MSNKKDAITAPNNQDKYTKSKKISKECRKESYIQRPLSRKKQILQIMGDKEMTARQVCRLMKHTDLNFVRPRMTEMVEEGLLEVVGKAYDKATERNVSVYKAIDKYKSIDEKIQEEYRNGGSC